MATADRVALVTGAGHRVGRAIALGLGEHGLRVAVHYNSSDDGARETVRLLGERGSSGEIFRADLTDAAACPRLVEDVVAAFGRLDVLVNSAAIMLRTPFGEVSAPDWDRIFALNLRAPFLIAQAAAPHLARNEGCIINIADLAAFEAWPAYLPHGISKAGVVQMTRALARVLAPSVRVNGIAPGAVLLPEGWREESADHLRRTTPLRRLGDPEDVVHAVLYLVDASYVTGETLIVDGGRHIRT